MSRRQRGRKAPDQNLPQGGQHVVQPPPRQVRAVVRHSRFEGPLPPPSIMEGYDRVVPGAAERILRITEESAAFQRDINIKALSAQSSDIRRGQWFAFLVALSAIIAGVVAILTGNPVAGTAIISTTLAGGIGTFMFSRRKGETPTPLDHDTI